LKNGSCRKKCNPKIALKLEGYFFMGSALTYLHSTQKLKNVSNLLSGKEHASGWALCKNSTGKSNIFCLLQINLIKAQIFFDLEGCPATVVCIIGGMESFSRF
jgi:hypothetical protein